MTDQTLAQIIISNIGNVIKPLLGMMLGYWLIHRRNIDQDKCNDSLYRRRRERQILQPVVALLYCILAVVLINVFLRKVEVSRLWTTVAMVANSFLPKIGKRSIVAPFSGGAIVYANIAIILLYRVIKGITLRIFEKTMKKQEALDTFAGGYYWYDRTYTRWFLKDSYRGFQRLFYVFGRVSVVLASGLLAYSWINEKYTNNVFIIFPVVLVILMEEISNALDGVTKQEYENHLSGDDTIIARTFGNYRYLLNVYREYFGSQMLVSHPGPSIDSKNGPNDFLDKLDNSEDQLDELAAHFFKQQRDAHMPLDVDLMQGAVDLLHRKSVVFMDPFYRDLTNYILLPVVDAMIRGQKCLVLVGNRDIADDVNKWIQSILTDYAKVSGIWRSSKLNQNRPDCEVGIMDFPSIYDIKVLNANKEFFQKVSICLLVEASNMIPTAQIGLNIVVQEMNNQQNPPVYCVIDRVSDGLVDTLSHVLQTNITDVVAEPIPRCSYTGIAWNANADFQRERWFKKETRFLGNGVEIASLALKYQVPHVAWYGGKMVPVKDLEWITGQYYPQVSSFVDPFGPKQQNDISTKFAFEANLWQAGKAQERFVIVEDQYCNLFEAMRMFLSRGENQSFVNVMAGSYLLRDYMHYNMQIFLTDPKAIPSIVPDYVRTERNTILKLLIKMAAGPVSEVDIRHELTLLGNKKEITSVYAVLVNLVKEYTLADSENLIEPVDVSKMENVPLSEKMHYFALKEDAFETSFGSTLKNAYYVVENDKLEKEFVDAKLFGLLTQCILPGQFLVVNGKYYQVDGIHKDYGVLLRRASDRYDKRVEYRQIRKYVFEPDTNLVGPISHRKIMDFEVSYERRNFRVLTTGYLDMKAYHDLKTAKVIDLTQDPLYEDLDMPKSIFEKTPARHSMERAYHNKTVLRIRIPSSDCNMRTTLAMLLQEMFRTVYPDNWQYIAVLTDKDLEVAGMLNYMLYDSENLPYYEIKSEPTDPKETPEITKLYEDIFIVEDSELDLGILESIDHNFMRFMSILTDYLTWHTEQMHAPESSDPVKNKDFSDKEKEKGEVVVQKSRFMNQITKLFGGLLKNVGKKKKKGAKEEEKSEETHIEKEEGKTSKEKKEPATVSLKADNVEDEVDENEVIDPTNSDEMTIGDEIKNGTSSEQEEDDSDEDDFEEGNKLFGLGKKKKQKTDTKTKKKKNLTNDDEVPYEETEDEDEDEESQEDENSAGPIVDRHSPWEETDDDSEFMDEEDEDLVEKGSEDDLFMPEGMPDDFDSTEGLLKLPETRYQRDCFLKFGFNEIDERITIDSLTGYLTARGFGISHYEETEETDGDQTIRRKIGVGDNSLMNARNSDSESFMWDMENAVAFCDFCGRPLTGVHFESLQDGRTRCHDCSATAIESVEEFKKLFVQHFELMQIYYQIIYTQPVEVKLADAKKIAKHSHAVFVPTKYQDPRVVGFAQYYKGEYSLFLENGSPRLRTIDTMVHEMTHIWQYINWNVEKKGRVVGNKLANEYSHFKDVKIVIYEGMAVWSAIQYLHLIGENAYADLQQRVMENQLSDALKIAAEIYVKTGKIVITDPYSFGYFFFEKEYGFSTNLVPPGKTPFNNYPPIDTDLYEKIVALIKARAALVDGPI